MRLRLLILFLAVALTTTAQDKLVISHGPYLQHLGETGVTIIWTTNKKAVSWVELAPDDNTHFYLQERPKYYSAEYGFKAVETVHTIRLSNLPPGTTYRYRIYSQEVLSHEGTKVQYGTVAATNVYSAKALKFSTTDQSKENKISFLMINDIHGRNDLLENLLNKGDYQSADFIFFNGDMVSDLQNEEQLFGGFMDTAIRLFAKEKPMYYARGNHETRGNFANAFPKYFTSPTGKLYYLLRRGPVCFVVLDCGEEKPMYYARGNHETRGNFANTFPKYFTSPTGKLYYLLRRGPVCFVVLDCGEDKPDSDIEYSDIVAFDQYRDAEADWLRGALKSPEFKDASFKVVILHMPPFGGWHGEEEMAQKFVPLLNEAKVDVVLCGHLHKYIHQPAGNGVNFPIIVNANTMVVKAEADAGLLKMQIINEKGELVELIQLKK